MPSTPKGSQQPPSSRDLDMLGDQVSTMAESPDGRIAGLAGRSANAAQAELNRAAMQHAPEVGIEGVAGKTGTQVLPMGRQAGRTSWRGGGKK